MLSILDQEFTLICNTYSNMRILKEIISFLRYQFILAIHVLIASFLRSFSVSTYVGTYFDAMKISEDLIPKTSKFGDNSDMLTPLTLHENPLRTKSANSLDLAKTGNDEDRQGTKDDLLSKDEYSKITAKLSSCGINPQVPVRSDASLLDKAVVIFNEGQLFRARRSFHGQDLDELTFTTGEILKLESSALSNEYW